MTKQKRLKNYRGRLILAALLAIAACGLFTGKAKAATSASTPAAVDCPVVVEKIDYEELEVTVNASGNSIVYFSDKNRSVWDTVTKTDAQGKFILDISWVSLSSLTTLYVKGDVDETAVKVELPKQAPSVKTTFSKAEGTITFKNLPDTVDSFVWRKASSYNWSAPVDIDDAGDTSSQFCKSIETLRSKGAKIYIRFPQKVGTLTGSALDVGSRQGKEIAVSISKRANAPKIKINGSTMALNTSTSMEYSLDGGVTWIAATKKMNLRTMVPGVFAGAAAADKSILFRIMEKPNKAPHSKMTSVFVPAQRPAPAVGTDVVSAGTTDKKFGMIFSNASKTNPYEYVVVKPGYIFYEDLAKWKSVTSSKTIYLAKASVPDGSVVYLRKRTTAANSTTTFELASNYTQMTVTYLQ